MKSLFLLLFFSLSLAGQEITPPDSPAIPEDTEVSAPPAASDEEIKMRLSRIFSAIEELSTLKVEVTHGVVTLSGKVASGLAEEEALTLAKSAEGVVFVRDELEENVAVEARLTPAKEKAVEIGRSFLQKLPLIAIALTIFAISWILGSWLGSRRTWLRKLGVAELSAGLVGRIIKLAVVGLGLFIALEILDATAIAAGILGVAGVAGIALGFAFQNIVENYLAGVLLSMRNPFSTGDAVQFGEHTGKVVRLTTRDTVLMTYDGNHLRIPNSLIITSALTNFSRNPLRRFDFAVGVSTDLDLSSVRDLGIETLDEVSAVLGDPPPYILVEELGDSTVNLRFFGWVDQRESDFLKTKSETIRLIKERFDDAGIEMPEPIYRVHLRQPGDKASPPPSAVTERKSGKAQDTSVDDTIDKQVAAIDGGDDEPNLLTDKEAQS